MLSFINSILAWLGDRCIESWAWLNIHTRADAALVVIAFVVGALALKLVAEFVADTPLSLAQAFQLSFNTLPVTLVFGVIISFGFSITRQVWYEDDRGNEIGPCVGLFAGYALGWLIACTTVLTGPEGQPVALGKRLLCGLLAWLAVIVASVVFILLVVALGEATVKYVDKHGLEPYLWLILMAAFLAFIYAVFVRASARWITRVRLNYGRALLITLVAMPAWLLLRVILLYALGSRASDYGIAISCAAFACTFLAGSLASGFLIARTPQPAASAATPDSPASPVISYFSPTSTGAIGAGWGSLVALVSVAILYAALFAASTILSLFA